MRISTVILSDEEIAAQVRAENEGQPEEWIAELIEQALVPRRQQAEAVQADYDANPPARAYVPPNEG